MDDHRTHRFNLELSTGWYFHRRQLHQRNAQRDAGIDADLPRAITMVSSAMGQSWFIFGAEFINAVKSYNPGLVLSEDSQGD